MREEPDIDLSTLADRFIENGDYTKEVILEELQYWQKQPDFLCITKGDGFFIAYRNRDSLWIAQVRMGGKLTENREGFKYAVKWAKDRGMTSITFETSRKQTNAMKRYGFEEYSVIMRQVL